MNTNILLLLLLIIIESFKQPWSSTDKTLDHYIKTFLNYEDGDGDYYQQQQQRQQLHVVLHTSCTHHALHNLTNLANKEGGRWLRLCRLNKQHLAVHAFLLEEEKRKMQFIRMFLNREWTTFSCFRISPWKEKEVCHWTACFLTENKHLAATACPLQGWEGRTQTIRMFFDRE